MGKLFFCENHIIRIEEKTINKIKTMKKFISFLAFLAIVTITSAQVRVSSNGNVGIGTTNPSVKLQIAGGGNYIKIDPVNLSGIGSNIGALYFWESTTGFNKLYGSTYYNHSDERSKENILSIENAISILKRISGYSYFFKDASIETRQREFGVLAQQVEKVLPELVSTVQMENDQEVKLVNYAGFIPFLIEAIKEQQIEIETLQQKIEELEKCCQTKEEGKNILNFELTDPTDGDTEIIKVYQNAPNPFHSTTTIQCYIPQTVQKAQLCIYNMQGI
ncbi:tail fiber domain-containing protein, partial [Bacteroidales bacterium OttesenSCG-928-B11]|nr:tail fiber domain-containing protein [Bacteroidales bacterium OttesenSCG-928-B11]